jgi:glucose/arabinose dehydrogenase
MQILSRQRAPLFALLVCVGLAFTPKPVQAQITTGDVIAQLQLVADGLTAPVSLTHAGDGSGRLFVVDQVGQIRIIQDGALLSDPFLDLTGEIVTVNPFFDERGLLGLAFHPDYASNGRFFTRHSIPRAGSPGEPCFGSSRGCHTEVLAEFSVSADPNVANPAGTVLFAVDEPQFNHDSGGIAFGPDGFLYFTVGDGGGAHDGLADTPPSHGPIGNGQNIFTTLGSILRIDVDSGAPYAIPPDNPFVGVPGEDEIYAYGMRNPYRFSFDRQDGRLFLADVGQNLFEEIDIVERGGNYGWVIREGFHCFDPFDPLTPPTVCANTGPLGEPLLDPVAEYDHSDGIAVIGGFVYRGSEFPELVGKYVFGDFSRSFAPADGRLFYLDADGDLSTIFELRNGILNLPLQKYLFGMGEDEAGEIYALTSDNLGPGGNTGKVFHIDRLDHVTLCHVPPGNPDDGLTITVGTSSVPAHLAHGDQLGVCPRAVGDRIIFEAFGQSDNESVPSCVNGFHVGIDRLDRLRQHKICKEAQD